MIQKTFSSNFFSVFDLLFSNVDSRCCFVNFIFLLLINLREKLDVVLFTFCHFKLKNRITFLSQRLNLSFKLKHND